MGPMFNPVFLFLGSVAIVVAMFLAIVAGIAVFAGSNQAKKLGKITVGERVGFAVVAAVIAFLLSGVCLFQIIFYWIYGGP